MWPSVAQNRKNFEIVVKICPFTIKIKIFHDFELHKHISIPIMLKFCLREQTWESLNDIKIRQNRLKDSARGLPVWHCLGDDAY